MCRMIMAHGQFEVDAVLDTARAMCSGETAQHDGPIKQHPNGWGCLWLERGEVRTLHGTGSFADALPQIDSRQIHGRFLAVHVRHATLSTNSGIAFSHPLRRRSAQTDWYLMHNGFLPTIYQQLGMPASRFDSAEYLQYLVDDITPADLTRDYLKNKMTKVAPGGSAGNAFIVNRHSAWAWQWHPDDTPFPRYFTLNHYQDAHTQYIASESILTLGKASLWRQMGNHQLHKIHLTE